MFETLIPSGAAGKAVAWLLTYALHSTLFLGLALVASRRLAGRWARLEEAVWRFALVAALATATLQLAAGWEPVAGRWTLDVASSSTTVSTPAATAVVAERHVTPLSPVSRSTQVAAQPVPAAPTWRIDSRSAVSAVLGLWACGALLLALHWGWLSLRLRRHLKARPEVIGGGMFSLLRQLTAEQGLSEDIRLTCSSRVSVPVALGLSRPEICVPPRALSHLEPEQQQGMLAHELAHLVRRDPFWLTFSHLVASVLFFQPLNWVARRRLRELSERLCDEWAVERTGRPLSLARCLAEVAGWSVQPARALPVPSMADQPSHLARRIRHLLDDGRSPERRVRPVWLGVGMMVLLVGVAAVAPGVYSAVAAEQEPEPSFQLAQAVDPVDPVDPVEPEEPADFEDELDIELEEEPFEGLEQELEELATKMESLADLTVFVDLGDLEGLEHLAELGDLGEIGISDEELERISELSERSGEEAEELARKYSALAEQMSEKYGDDYEARAEEITRELEPKLERISEEIHNKLAPELERLSEDIHRNLGPEIERLSERIANEFEPEMERLHEETRRLHKEGRLDDQERERIRREARELSRRARPSEEEMKAIHELQRKHGEDMRSFMEQHRGEIDAATREAREQADAIRQEMNRRMESDPKLRELRENQRRDMEQIRERHREEMRQHREKMKQDRERSREKDKDKEKKAA